MEGNNYFIHDTKSIFVLYQREPCTDRGNFKESKNQPGICNLNEKQEEASDELWGFFFFPLPLFFCTSNQIKAKMFWLLQLRLGGEERSPLTSLAMLKSKDDCSRSSFPPSFHSSWVTTVWQAGATFWSFSGARRGTGKCLTQVKQFTGIKKEKNF